MTDNTSPPRDERRVLEELERLRDAIKSTRNRREAAEAQFAGYLEKFLPASESASQPAAEESATVVPYRRGGAEPAAPQSPERRWETLFAEERPAAREPGDAPSSAPGTPPKPVIVKAAPLVRPVRPEPEPVEHGVAPELGAAVAGEPSTTIPDAVTQPAGHEDPLAEIMRRLRPEPGDAPPPAPPPPILASPPASPSRMPMTVALAAVVLLALAGGWALFLRGADGAPRAREAAEAAAAPVETPSAEPVAPPPVAAPEPLPPAAPLQIVVRTTRHVWLRLIVDGDLRLEKEVAAGERYPLGARQAIVIRAGDAGAVTVEVDGQPAEPLGGDGQVLTRRFAPR